MQKSRGLGFGVKGVGCRVQGVGFRVVVKGQAKRKQGYLHIEDAEVKHVRIVPQAQPLLVPSGNDDQSAGAGDSGSTTRVSFTGHIYSFVQHVGE